jgi:hypothetical protein
VDHLCDRRRASARHGAPPSCLPTRRESPVGGEPGEEHGVFEAGLAPDVDDRELAGAQEPSERLRAGPQPPLRFGKRSQLRRCGELQGEVRLPRGRAASWAEASGRGRHGRGFTLQSRTCDAVDGDGSTDSSGPDRSRGDRPQKMCYYF